MAGHLLIFGLGYTGRAVAALARDAGWRVTATERRPSAAMRGVARVAFAAADAAIREASHVLATAAPGMQGDPVLAAYGEALQAALALRWVCYLSTTGVYGDRQGAWVDEAAAPSPLSERGRRRVAAELEWSRLADRRAVELFRLAGIYGPGRSALDDLRAGTARRIVAPGHRFGRVHRDDIAGAVMAAMKREGVGVRVLHGNDDLPAASADVVEEAARLLGMPPPPARSLESAWPAMSEMARSFWAENRLVASAVTQTALARRWTYPTYREGLRAILESEQTVEQGIEHGEVGGTG